MVDQCPLYDFLPSTVYFIAVLAYADMCDTHTHTSQFRIICNLLHTETKRKFPDLEWPIATGGFFFLRYICPTIVAPETIMPEFATRASLFVIAFLPFCLRFSLVQ